MASKGIIMIIDDTPDNLSLLSDTLSEADYRVLVATDGLSALEQITYLKPDIILLDVIMPGIDGFETCHRLKSNPAWCDIPIIFMTALSDLDYLLRGFSEGAVDYLVKPIRPPEVLARIDVQLTTMRMLQRAEQALSQCDIAALAINAQGMITWLTPIGIEWLSVFANTHALAYEPFVDNLLPPPIYEWFMPLLQTANAFETPPIFQSFRADIEFLIKINPCEKDNEYLLMLEKHSGEWDLDTVRSAFGLTFRETEILMWISRGKTNKEIGVILGSSARTVSKHLENIFGKLGVASRAAAVSTVLQRQS
jgi:CheY-like chemotaxis protein/DNA-binding CsgD family transcriptional regulator